MGSVVEYLPSIYETPDSINPHQIKKKKKTLNMKCKSTHKNSPRTTVDSLPAFSPKTRNLILANICN